MAFDFDHWEEKEEDSQFPQGKRGCAHFLGSCRSEGHGLRTVALVGTGRYCEALRMAFLLVADLGAKCSGLRRHQFLIISIPSYNPFTEFLQEGN